MAIVACSSLVDCGGCSKATHPVDASGDSQASPDIWESGPPITDGVSQPSCGVDWPSAGRNPQSHASLDVKAGVILWSRSFSTTQIFSPGHLDENGGLVLSQRRLAFAAHGPLVLVDTGGSVSQSDPMASSRDWASPATVDQDGNLYSVALSGVYSFDSSGKTRWRFPTTNQTGAEFMEFYPPALSPDGVLFAVCADGYLRAMSAQDGQEIWRQSAVVSSGPSQVMGGGGGAVFMLNGISGVHAYDSKTGQHLVEFQDSTGPHLFSSKGMWALGWEFGIQFGAIDSFDCCGRLKWTTLASSTYADRSGVISFGEVLVSTKWDIDSSGNRTSADRMYRYASDGAIVQGPVSGVGEPYLAGADGTIYTVNCEYSSPKANQIIAYTSDLRELWRLDFGAVDQCPVGNGILDDNGILYLARGKGSTEGVEIVAIQTQSPGLAESSWPSLRHDNRGTMWLSPL
jgi:outer membrane protein assembly factor BamB